MPILRITLWSLALRGLTALALLASPGSARASRTGPPLVLVETRKDLGQVTLPFDTPQQS